MAHPLAVLGKENDYPGSFRYWPSQVLQRANGGFIAIEPGGGMKGGPWWFGADGRFLKALGRDGEGPGEYRVPGFILNGRGDSLLILDLMLRRLSVLSVDGNYRRSEKWPTGIVPSAVQLPDGRFVINARFNDAQRAGKPLHFLTAAGEYQASFDYEEVTPVSGEGWIRFIAAAPDSTFWTVTWARRYRIEHWSAEGKLLESIEPKRNWFPPSDRPTMTSPEHPPDPMVAAVWFDSASGRLWVASVVADPQWRRGLGAASRSPEGAVTYEFENQDRVYDGVIEIFDTRTRRLYAAGRFDRAIRLGMHGFRAVRFHEDEEGRHLAEIYSLELTQ